MERLFDSRHFGARIKKRRGSKNLRDTARELGTSTSTLDRIERGVLVPDVEFFLRLCAWMEALPHEFFHFPAAEGEQPGPLEQVERALRRENTIDPELAEAIITLLGLLYKRPAR